MQQIAGRERFQVVFIALVGLAVSACTSNAGPPPVGAGPNPPLGPSVTYDAAVARPGTGDAAGTDAVQPTGGGKDVPTRAGDAGGANGDGGGSTTRRPSGDAADAVGRPVPDIAHGVDISFDEPDTGCVPQCEGKVCGPDGCGSICGFCPYGKACNEDGTECTLVCDPITPCQGKACGPDGCGGTCGECDAGFKCGEDGQCYLVECVPDCEGRECGPDGCGGVCGTCKGIQLCNEQAGVCEDDPCGFIGDKGKCDGKYKLLTCADGQPAEIWCPDVKPNYRCTWSAFQQKFICGEAPNCTPDCVEKGKQCGDDGCGGTCGNGCPPGWPCIDFKCVPEEGGACFPIIPVFGECIDNKRYFCGGNKVVVEDCGAKGKTCKCGTTSSGYECACQ